MEHRVSKTQLEDLLNYLMEHQALAKGIGLGPRSKETVDRQWEELASKLNAHGSGASKSGYRWKRYWADLKHKVKARASAQRRAASGTVGGPGCKDDLSEIDKKVLAIIGEAAAYGDTQHRVPAFPIPTPSTSSAIYEDIATECVEITIESSPPPPASERLIDIGQTTTPISPSTRGNTVSDRVQAPASTDPNRTWGPRSNADSPVSRRLPRGSVRRRTISDLRTRQRVDPSWIVDMEHRRIDAEQKLVDAIMIIAEARRDELDISRRQLALTETLAQALRELTNVLKNCLGNK
ncbi:uncharacterized protein LOC123705184 isoform X2 [Colias croceus]|uniref:uncharacterized protein LOC123705184 isoform X2 n=1 Tax=Colias crocea TaxID=72248 RepID=UPI001E27B229|nr:uncharacterized protein LOC123705184 isoform X2 [Colias croceus]